MRVIRIIIVMAFLTGCHNVTYTASVGGSHQGLVHALSDVALKLAPSCNGSGSIYQEVEAVSQLGDRTRRSRRGQSRHRVIIQKTCTD
jgi:hypothetical protein